jgi:hypothetical protein
VARPAPDPELVAKAWELHAHEGRSARYIAEKLHISPDTAARWVREGKAAEQYIDLLDRAEERVRMATRLDFYTGALVSEWHGGVAKAVEVIPILLKIEERRAKLVGLDAPTRIAVEDSRSLEVDPATVAAVRKAQQRAAEEEKALLEGEAS